MTEPKELLPASRADQEAAMKIACEVVLDYGEGGEREHSRARNGNLWRDHPAFLAALEGMALARHRLTEQARPAEPVVEAVLAWLRSQKSLHAGGVSVPGSAIKAIADAIERKQRATLTEATPVVASDELVELAVKAITNVKGGLTYAFYRDAARAALSAALPHIERGVIERCAKVAEKRAEERFAEYGVREPDTNATYYEGLRGETLEELDEEDETIAAAIRALSTEHDHEG